MIEVTIEKDRRGPEHGRGFLLSEQPANEHPRPLRILMAAGGTGGHIFPALAVAEELRERWEKERREKGEPVRAGGVIQFLGTARGLEARLIPAAGFPLMAKRNGARLVEELRGVKQTAVPDAELQRSKDHLKGSLMLSLENTASRMSHLARQEIYFDRQFGLDETLQGIERVTSGDVRRVAEDLFKNGALSATVLGNVNGLEIPRTRLDLD